MRVKAPSYADLSRHAKNAVSPPYCLLFRSDRKSDTEPAQPHGRLATFSPAARALASIVAIQQDQPIDLQIVVLRQHIGGDECRDLLQVRQSCLGIDYRAAHAAIRARTSAAE